MTFCVATKGLTGLLNMKIIGMKIYKTKQDFTFTDKEQAAE